MSQASGPEHQSGAKAPVRGPSHDGIYPRCVWCGGENWTIAVLDYSAGEVPCVAVPGCGRFLPEHYKHYERKN